MSVDFGSMITTGPKNGGPKMVLMYSVPGTGKTMACDKLPNAIFIPTEDNVDEVESAKFPVANTYEEAWNYAVYLLTNDHNYEYVVQDSISSLAKLAEASVCQDNGVATLSDIKWGGGKTALHAKIINYVDLLKRLKTEKGMTVIMTGHADIKKKPDPEKVGEEYSQYTPKLLDTAIEYIKETCNAILFCKKKDISVVKDEKFGQKKNAGVITNERIMYTQEKGGAMAKCACKHMPEEWPLDMPSFFWYWKDKQGYEAALQQQTSA